MTKPLPKATQRLRNAFLRASHDLIRAVAASCPGFHHTRDHLDGRPPWCDACGRDRFGFLHAGDDLAAEPGPLGVEDLQSRYGALQQAKRNIDAELIAVEDRLRAAGRWRKVGRPRKEPTHTEEEAREAHRRWQAGHRTPWVEAGHRQYLRERRRENRGARP